MSKSNCRRVRFETINQSDSHPVSQSNNQCVNPLTVESITQSINPPTHQSINPSFNHSRSQWTILQRRCRGSGLPRRSQRMRTRPPRCRTFADKHALSNRWYRGSSRTACWRIFRPTLTPMVALCCLLQVRVQNSN